MAVLLPLTERQRASLLSVPSDCVIPYDSFLREIFTELNLPAVYDMEKLIATLETHGNWLYNYMLLEIRHKIVTHCNEHLTTFSRVLEDSLIGIYDFRYVWLYTDCLKLAARSMRTYPSEQTCLHAARINEPSYDSNDGLGTNNVIVSMETGTLTNTAEDIAIDGFSQLQISPCCVLRRSPWYIYSAPPIYHYQIMCKEHVLDNFSSGVYNLSVVKEQYCSGSGRQVVVHDC